MSITIHNILKLEVFKNSIILAGKGGLDRTVIRISVFDCPLDNDIESDRILQYGDFFISDFFQFKDNLQNTLHFFEVLIKTGSCGLCIINQYVNTLPNEVIDFCNKRNYPVIVIDYHISYADIIKDTMELIIQDQYNTILEMKISEVLNNNKSNREISRLLYEINPHLKNNITVIYCLFMDEDNLYNTYLHDYVNQYKDFSTIKYKKGIIFVITYDDKSIDKRCSKIQLILSRIKEYSDRYVIGISNHHDELLRFGDAVNEAIVSTNFSEFYSGNIIYYKDLGIERLLMPLKDNYELKAFYNDIFEPVKKYDKENKSELLRTVITFFQNDGDYKKTSKDLYQHENTIRYRIMKVRSILNMENSNIRFYEHLSIAVKIHRMLFKE